MLGGLMLIGLMLYSLIPRGLMKPGRPGICQAGSMIRGILIGTLCQGCSISMTALVSSSSASKIWVSSAG